MSNKPTHTAYIVTDAKEGSDKKAFWNEVAIGYEHKNGDGLDLLIPAGVSLSGKIVIRKRKEQSDTDAQ